MKRRWRLHREAMLEVVNKAGKVSARARRISRASALLQQYKDGKVDLIELYNKAYKRGYQAGWERRDATYYKTGIRVPPNV